MQVEMWKTSQVKPYDKNPRRNDGAVDAVAASIREFGFQQPIVVDRDGIIIAGHTRHKAARKLGLKEVPVVVADGLSPEKVKAYRLADNKTGELAEWEIGSLEEELGDLCNFDMEQFGFAASAIADTSEVTEDEYDTPAPEEPKSKLGDIYRLGRHILMCGDATDAESVQKLCQGGGRLTFSLQIRRMEWTIPAKQKRR